ncbi:MAG TPA: WbqC family protein [Candidatus Baltobacteraceae bacterium]|nr:WbqC family protein [Candidatus Baltobacteraceae bacterium]
MTTIAVMQPYFFPYAGYFRLFTAADTVVMFDCVQFPRRGWVHRNRFADAHGNLDWLTLPLVKADRDARIDELRLPPDVRGRLETAMRRFPVLERALKGEHPLISRALDFPSDDAAGYLCGLVRDVTSMLNISKPMIRSSTLHIDPALRAGDRVLAIVKALGGTRYVNPPGGRDLYDRGSFAHAGVELCFLPPYGAGSGSILSRLLTEPPQAISREIERETALVE